MNPSIKLKTFSYILDSIEPQFYDVRSNTKKVVGMKLYVIKWRFLKLKC